MLTNRWILAAVIVLLPSCTGRTSFGNSQKQDIPVKVMTVAVTEEDGSNSYVGTASASKTAFLSCRYPGRVASVRVKEGDYVRQGDIIAEVESQSVVSAYQIACSTLKQAEDGYERAAEVHRSGSIADVKMIEAETRLAQARASAEAAEAAKEECMIKAPFSGVIGKIMVNEGEEINSLDQIACILDISTIEIRFPVPESEVSGISEGDAARITVPALKMESFPAKVIAKGIVASPLSHTYECTAVPSGRMDGLMPGMVVKVCLDARSGKSIVIPASVVRTDAGGRYVWTVLDGGTVSKRYVVPEGFSGKGVVISEGLSEGEKIITEGVQKVCTGMKVRVVE